MKAIEIFLHPIRASRTLSESRAETMRLSEEINRKEKQIGCLTELQESSVRKADRLKRSRRKLALKLADVRARLIQEFEAQKADESDLERILHDIDLMKEKQTTYLNRIANLRTQLAKAQEELRTERLLRLPPSLHPIDMTDSDSDDVSPAASVSPASSAAPASTPLDSSSDSDSDWLIPLP